MCCTGTNPVIPKVQAATSGTSYTLLNDTFDNGLSGWQYYGISGYQLSLDNSAGVPAPSAHISGDITASTQCEHVGMAKVVDISSYTGGNLTLGFNWRASSTGDGTTNAYVSVNDGDTGDNLFTYQLILGTSPDTDWQYHSNNLASYISGDKRLQIVLYLEDCWHDNWSNNNWYDNISLVWNNSPIAPNAPTGLKATAASPSQINLSWTPPANDGGSPVAGYKIERSTDFGYNWTTIVADTNSAGTTYSDTGLGSGYYTYHVSAINAIGTGQPSNLATANTAGGNTIEYSSSSSFTGTVNATDTMIIDKGVTLSTNGITNYGLIRNMGTIQISYTQEIDNHNFIFNAAGALIQGGTMNNYKSAEITSENAMGVATLNNYGIFNGTASGNYGSAHYLNNYGTYYGSIADYGGRVNNYATGVIQTQSGGELYSSFLTNYGTITSYGGISLYFSGLYTNGTFNNHSSITIADDQGSEGITNDRNGTFNNFAGASISIPTRTGGYVKNIYNVGTFNNNGLISSSNLIANRGVFNNNGTITNTHGGYGMSPADINNYGTFNNNPSGTINNNGWFNNKCNASYNNSGYFTGNPAFGDCTTNQIAMLDPASGPVGSQVTVTGNNFAPGHVISVFFDSLPVRTSPSTITSNSTGGFVGTFSVPSTNRFGQALVAGSKYSVSATDGAYSATTAFTILATPGAPGNPQASAGNSQTLLTWYSPNSGDSPITSYKIYRGTSSGSETLLATVGDVISYHDYAVTNGQEYFYRVTAVNSIGESPQSREASATPIANNVVALVPAGKVPFAVAANPATDKIYVANEDYNTVSVVNGSTNDVISTVRVGSGPSDIDVDQATNEIYVTNIYDNTVSVIDGATDRVAATIPVGNSPASVGVDTKTDRVYVVNSGFNGPTYDNSISVIDGSTNTVVATIPVSGELGSIAVNPNTDKIYFDYGNSNLVSVIDGATNSITASIQVSSAASGIGVNPSTDMIYVASEGYTTNPDTNNVSVIDGSTNTVVATIPVGVFPFGVSVNPATNKIYVANSASDTVSVIDGATSSVVDAVHVGTGPLDVATDPITDLAYAVNRYSDSVSVIDGSKYGASGPSTQVAGITLNNVQSTSGTTDPSNQITLSGFNAGTGSNQLLVVGVSANSKNVASVTFGGKPLTQAVSSFYNNDAEFWYLRYPSGTGDITVTMNGQTQAVVGAYSFSNVNQSSPIPTEVARHNTSASSPSISINTKHANDLVLDLPSIWGGVTLGSPTCTQEWDLNMPNKITGASSSITAQSPASVTCKWTASSADFWDDVAIEIESFAPYGSSTVTTTTVPSSPTALTASAVSSSRIDLSWTAPSSNGGSPITGYQIQRSTDNGTTWSTVQPNTGSTTTAYSDTGLAANVTYTYRVGAINAAGTGSPSSTASATTQSGISFGYSNSTSITLNNVQSTSGTTDPSNQITLSKFNATAGNDRLLVVGVSANSNSVGSITFAGTPLARAVSHFTNNDAEFWYLADPAGTGNITVTMNGPTQAVVGAYSFSGVNQTVPIPAHITRHNLSPSSPAISITTSHANDWVLDLPSIWGGVTLGSSTCTQQWDVNVPGQITGASSSTVVPSPGTVTCSWAASGDNMWDDSAIELKAN